MWKIAVRALPVLAACACCQIARAHGNAAADDELGWTWESWFVLSLLLACGWYAAGCWRLWRNGNLRTVLGLRPAGFAGGMLALVIALASPLDALADHLFSAHMTQHLFLMIVAPPLLVWGRPTLAWLWACPLPARRAVGRWWAGSSLHGLHAFLMKPLTVWLAASVALWAWHVPGLYDWALSDENVHIAEHLCFFITSLAFWTLVVEPYGARRTSHGVALVGVATFALHSGLLGALLTFASQPLYLTHETLAYGLTPLEDQQLAGLIMWVPASVLYLAALAILFVGWLNAARPARHFRSVEESDSKAVLWR